VLYDDESDLLAIAKFTVHVFYVQVKENPTTTGNYKKLCCHKEAARCFVSV